MSDPGALKQDALILYSIPFLFQFFLFWGLCFLLFLIIFNIEAKDYQNLFN